MTHHEFVQQTASRIYAGWCVSFWYLFTLDPNQAVNEAEELAAALEARGLHFDGEKL